MDIGSYIAMASIAVILLYAILIYNGLVRIRHNVSKAWANIDVLLKQRHDELPKLVAVCKGYMQHEREVLENIVNARSMASDARTHEDVKKVGESETLMRRGLNQLFMAVEAYPDLKADRQFKHLQQRITGLENQIADRREYYNETVRVNNTRIEMFPDIIIARLFNFGQRIFLRFSEVERADVHISTLFKAE